MNASNLLPAEIWIPILDLTTLSPSLLASSTRFLTDLHQSYPHLSHWPRRRIAHYLLLALYKTDGACPENDLLNDLTPHEQLVHASKQGERDHPLQALLRITSAPLNRRRPECALVHDFLLHTDTLVALLGSRPQCNSSLTDDETLPELVEQSLDDEWASDHKATVLDPILIACIYSTHFVYLGDAHKLSLTLDLLLALLPNHVSLTEPRQAASPLRWSLAAVDSLSLGNLARKFCEQAEIGVYAWEIEYYAEFGNNHPDDDLPFRMTFPEYLVWLALFYWRVDVAQFLADRFAVNVGEVMRRVWNLPELRGSVLWSLPRLIEHQSGYDFRDRGGWQFEWMKGHGWDGQQDLDFDTYLINHRLQDMCSNLPVTEESYPSFVRLLSEYTEHGARTTSKAILQPTFDLGLCGKVAAFVELDSSFVGAVPFVFDHVGLVQQKDEQVRLLMALLRCEQLGLAKELVARFPSPHEVLLQVFRDLLQSDIYGRRQTPNAKVYTALFNVGSSLAIPVNWTKSLCSFSHLLPRTHLCDLIIVSQALPSTPAFDCIALFHHLLQRSLTSAVTQIDSECKSIADLLCLLGTLFQQLEASSSANPVWGYLDKKLDMHALLVLCAHLLLLVSTSLESSTACPVPDHTCIRITIDQLVARFVSDATQALANLTFHARLTALLKSTIVLPSLKVLPESLALPSLDQLPDSLFAFTHLAQIKVACALIPWSTATDLPFWIWAVARPGPEDVSKEVVERELRRMVDVVGWEAVEQVVQGQEVGFPHWGDEMRARVLAKKS